MKIMALQHAVKYDEARDWICLQDQDALTYKSLLTHCKQLEPNVSSLNKLKLKVELTSPALLLPEPATPPYIPTHNQLQPTKLAKDVVTPTLT